MSGNKRWSNLRLVINDAKLLSDLFIFSNISSWHSIRFPQFNLSSATEISNGFLPGINTK